MAAVAAAASRSNPVSNKRLCCALSGIRGTYKREQSYLFIYKMSVKAKSTLISQSNTNYVGLYYS